jgi:hypothetical protein
MKVPIDDVLIPEQIQNPPDPRLLDEYSALCVPRMLRTVFTIGHSWTSFWARWNQSTPSHMRYYFFQSQSTSKSCKWVFTSGVFFNENFVCGLLSYVCDMSRPSHLFWTTEQIIKLLLCTLLHSPVFRPKYMYSPIPKYQLYSSLGVTYEVPHIHTEQVGLKSVLRISKCTTNT